MCGIFGWIKPTGAETDLDLVEILKKGLVKSAASRGQDATGFYAPSCGLVKDALEADEFVMEIPASIANDKFVIGHVRRASAKYDKTNIDDAKNAQPFESKRWVTVHNGTINTPRIKGYNYTSDIDSESIIAFAEKSSLRNALTNIDGDSTVVLFNKVENKMYFWTNGGRPLAVAYYHGIIFFASTKTILLETLKVKDHMGAFPDISFAIVYEREPLVFDFKKNLFYRQQIIPEKSKPKESVTTTVQNIYRTSQPITAATVKKAGTLPRGSGSACPPSPTNGQQLTLKFANQKDQALFNDPVTGQKVKVTSYCPGNPQPANVNDRFNAHKVVRISAGGGRKITIIPKN